MIRELKGRHVLVIAIAAFATILTANMALLFAATGTFPGLVVKNSYVAGVGWDAKAEAQAALGWTAEISHTDGQLRVALTGAEGSAIQGAYLMARIGRATTQSHDVEVPLVADADGYRAEVPLTPGLWRVDLSTSNGPAWRQGAEFIVRGDP